MGLDMYAYKAKRIEGGQIVDFPRHQAIDPEEIFYWRKHPNLHGWMQALYLAKGGQADSFNCIPVALDLADIDALEQAVRSQTLPHTTGFFFGESDGSEMEDDLRFIALARAYLKAGDSVFYTSWW